MTGFPSFDTTSSHRRSLVYLGSGQLRQADETRPSLLTAEQVSAMASKAGIQINALSTSSRNAGILPSVAKSSGGQYFSIDGRQDQMVGDLDAIRSNPPAATAPVEATTTSWFGDAPAVPLGVAVVASMLLCLSLMVLRR